MAQPGDAPNSAHPSPHLSLRAAWPHPPQKVAFAGDPARLAAATAAEEKATQLLSKLRQQVGPTPGGLAATWLQCCTLLRARRKSAAGKSYPLREYNFSTAEFCALSAGCITADGGCTEGHGPPAACTCRPRLPPLLALHARPRAPSSPSSPAALLHPAWQVMKLEKALQPLEQYLDHPGVVAAAHELPQQLEQRLEEAQQQQRERVQQLSANGAAPAAAPYANGAAPAGLNGLSNGSNGAVASALNGAAAGQQHAMNGHASASPAAAGPARSSVTYL